MVTIYYRDERDARERARVLNTRAWYDRRERVWRVALPLAF